MKPLDATQVALAILIIITTVTVGLIGYCVVVNESIPAVVMTLLGVVLGFLGTHLASAQGAAQAVLGTPASMVTPQTRTLTGPTLPPDNT